ncbi:hypothetical protein AFLA_008703 [Aspergillus flavus NRRL3357]|nr:hypothetical protein AFLA_008703 [Aspergillus flavus NRRL3357]
MTPYHPPIQNPIRPASDSKSARGVSLLREGDRVYGYSVNIRGHDASWLAHCVGCQPYLFRLRDGPTAVYQKYMRLALPQSPVEYLQSGHTTNTKLPEALGRDQQTVLHNCSWTSRGTINK